MGTRQTSGKPHEVLAAVLRAERERCGLSQERLALEAGIDRTYISLIERAHRNPSVNTLFGIADALGTRPSDLLRTVEHELGMG